MHNVSNNFIYQIGKSGKEVSLETNIVVGEETTPIKTQSFKLFFEGNIFKTVMQELHIEVKKGGILEGILEAKYGLNINGNYEYINFNQFNPYSTEVNIETSIAKSVLYDNMVKFMKDYNIVNLNIDFPCTVLELIQRICRICGVELYSEDFYNSGLIIEEDLFSNLKCTYRDILDYVCQVSCTTGIIKDNKLYFKKPEETGIVIAPNLLKKLKIKEHFGACNSLVLGRGDLNDNIYSKDNNSIAEIGLQEIKFDNNEIIDKRREEVIDGMFEQIKGLEYYAYEVSDIGIGIFEPCDYTEFQDLTGTNYKVLVLNQNLEITSGCTGNSGANVPDTSTTNYSYASDSQKRITKTEIQVNKQDQIITTTIEKQDQQSNKLTNIEADLDGVKTTIQDNQADVNEKINQIEQTIEGTAQTLTTKGGNNIFYYSEAYWNDGTEEGIANLEEYTDTEIQQKSVSKVGYVINSGVSEQKVIVKNDTYAISFTYKKILEASNCYVEINGIQYELNSLDWEQFSIVEAIDTNTVDVKFVSDTDGALEVFDLVGNIGTERQIWTQNPNEVRTDTVTIGKGIQINSSSTNTYARFDADGNRIYNSSTNEVVTELTDKGVDTDKVTADVGQIGGVLIQEIDEQTWISSLL